MAEITRQINPTDPTIVTYQENNRPYFPRLTVYNFGQDYTAHLTCSQNGTQQTFIGRRFDGFKDAVDEAVSEAADLFRNGGRIAQSQSAEGPLAIACKKLMSQSR